MRGAWLLLVLVVCVGCGKGDGPAAAGAPADKFDSETTGEKLVDAYRDNPATADQTFKGKVVRCTATVKVERAGNETIGRFMRGQSFNPATRTHDVIFHFTSEDVAAQILNNHWYVVQGRCEGLADGDVHVKNVSIVKQLKFDDPKSKK